MIGRLEGLKEIYQKRPRNLRADKTFKKRHGIVYKELTAGNIKDIESVKDTAVNYRPTFTSVTDLFVPTNLYAFFVTVTYPLCNNTIWDFKTTDHIINNVNNFLSGIFRPYKPELFFVGDRILYI